MNLFSRSFRLFSWRSRAVALVAGVVLAAWIGGCGSVSNKTDAGGTGGSGVGGAPGDGGVAGASGDGAADVVAGTGGAPGDAGVGGRTGTGGAPGDASADGGGAARWDIDNWDNAQWGP